MNPEFDEVLLTAYLDNEVTEAERAKVEQQLRASESSRMLLEELRSVRTLVAQLHLSQSSRNFQVGPWNETNSSNQASSVVLNDPGSKWNMSYQKLASIAALIAIVVCTSVLFLGPYRNSISHRSTGTNAARDEKPIDLAIKESVPTDQETVELVIRPGIASPSRTLSLPLGNEGLPRLEKNAADVSLPMSRGTAGAGFDNPQMGLAVNDSTKGGLGGGGSNAPLAKRKSAESENRMIESPPAPMLVDPANLGLELSKAEAQVQQTEPSAQLFFDSLFAMPSKDRGEWEAVDSKSNRDSYFFQKGQLADVLKRQAGELSPNDESIARLSFRYKNTQEQEKVLNEKGGQSAATPSDYVLTENKPTEDPIQTEADEKKSALVPILLEFQIPSEEWQNGAKQLRKLGIEVPLELPVSGYMDFLVIPTEATNSAAPSPAANVPEDRLDGDARVAGSQGLSQWKFQRLEPLGRVEAKQKLALDATVEKEFVPAKNGTESNEVQSIVRIRVRTIKK